MQFGTYVATLAVGVIGTIISVLFKRVVDKHDQEISAIKTGIKEISVKLDSKADQVEMNRQRDNIAELFRQSRQDKDEILEAIGTLNTTVLTELGKRPTREELSLAQGRKRG